MEHTQNENPEISQDERGEAAAQIYNHAADLLVNKKRDAEEVKNILIQKGIDAESAAIVVDNLEEQIRKAKKDRANKDMLYGALWCVGGIVATVAQIGYIFWGAIIFGGIQFFKGLSNA